MKMTFLILKKTGMLTSDFWILFIASIKGLLSQPKLLPNVHKIHTKTKKGKREGRQGPQEGKKERTRKRNKSYHAK